jgi:hypothetical protein
MNGGGETYWILNQQSVKAHLGSLVETKMCVSVTDRSMATGKDNKEAVAIGNAEVEIIEITIEEGIIGITEITGITETTVIGITIIFFLVLSKISNLPYRILLCGCQVQ